MGERSLWTLTGSVISGCTPSSFARSACPVLCSTDWTVAPGESHHLIFVYLHAPLPINNRAVHCHVTAWTSSFAVSLRVPDVKQRKQFWPEIPRASTEISWLPAGDLPRPAWAAARALPYLSPWPCAPQFLGGCTGRSGWTLPPQDHPHRSLLEENGQPPMHTWITGHWCKLYGLRKTMWCFHSTPPRASCSVSTQNVKVMQDNISLTCPTHINTNTSSIPPKIASC